MNAKALELLRTMQDAEVPELVVEDDLASGEVNMLVVAIDRVTHLRGSAHNIAVEGELLALLRAAIAHLKAPELAEGPDLSGWAASMQDALEKAHGEWFRDRGAMVAVLGVAGQPNQSIRRNVNAAEAAGVLEDLLTMRLAAAGPKN